MANPNLISMLRTSLQMAATAHGECVQFAIRFLQIVKPPVDLLLKVDYQRQRI